MLEFHISKTNKLVWHSPTPMRCSSSYGRGTLLIIIEMDRPDMTEQYQQMARIKPSNLLEGEVPHLIDEWQIATNIWNAVRYEVDRRGEFGQFILTGSSVPVKLDESMHTGTGRIVRMRMRPMSLFESRDSNGQVSSQSY